MSNSCGMFWYGVSKFGWFGWRLASRVGPRCFRKSCLLTKSSQSFNSRLPPKEHLDIRQRGRACRLGKVHCPPGHLPTCHFETYPPPLLGGTADVPGEGRAGKVGQGQGVPSIHQGGAPPLKGVWGTHFIEGKFWASRKKSQIWPFPALSGGPTRLLGVPRGDGVQRTHPPSTPGVET